MKSKTSFFNDMGGWFNKTLYLKNLTRYWPLWGLPSLGSGLLVLAFMLAAIRERLTMNALNFAQNMYDVVGVGVPPVMLCYCILCAMAVWSWLYNPRSVGLYHSLPIRREGLFLTSILSGLTMIAIPCAVTGLLAVLLSFALGGFSAKAFLVTIAAVAGEGFFYFASATIVAFITANTYALFTLYGIFHFLMPLLDMLGTLFASNLIFGLRSSAYTGVLPWLCPTVYLMENVRPRRLYDIPFPDDGLMRDYVNHWTGTALDRGWLIAVYALAGVVLLGLSWLLYRRRRSECAGDVIAVNWLKPVFQASVTAVCALGGGQVLYLMLMNGFDDNTVGKYALLPLILCMTFAGAIGYYAAAMFLAKSLRVFQKKTLPGVAVILACCTVLCSLLYFDVFGAEARIPGNENVKYVHLDIAGNNYFLYPGEDDELIEQVKDLHSQILAERDYITNFDDHMAPTSEETVWDYEGISIRYQLKHGGQVSRSYGLYLTRERVRQEGTFDYRMDQLVNSVPMRLRRLHAGDRHFRPESGTFTVERTGLSHDLSSRETAQLLDALAQDAKEGTWGTYDWFHDTWKTYALSLNMFFDAVDVDGNGQTNRSRDYAWIDIRAGMVHTIAALKDMGYVTDEDLITYEEYNQLMEDREKYGAEYDEASPAVPAPAVPEPDGVTLMDDGKEIAVTEDGQEVIVDREAANPNSYTPPASSGSLDVSGSSSGAADWPSANWDETADPGEVERYVSAG